MRCAIAIEPRCQRQGLTNHRVQNIHLLSYLKVPFDPKYIKEDTWVTTPKFEVEENIFLQLR